MRTAVLLTMLVAAVTCVSLRVQFDEWAAVHGRAYASQEERNMRFSVWRDNHRYMVEFNSQEHGWTLGMNGFADLTNEEYQAMLAEPTRVNLGKAQAKNAMSVQPVDWVAAGAVCPVKDQGQCGSCWAFSAIGAVEGCYEINTGNLKCFAEQQLVDCAGIKYGDFGCGGGLPVNGFNYIIDQGCELQTDYPYTAKRGDCLADAAKYKGDIAGFVEVASGNEVALQAAIVGTPVSVAIDASLKSFQLYTSGIYCPEGCSNTTLDHGVLAVGQNTDAATKSDYYIVKNSWGTSWGQGGYIWMCANKNNNCGIATMASYPTKCSDYVNV